MCLFQQSNLLSVTSAGMEVALVVNNLGGTSNLELSIMTNAAIRHLGRLLRRRLILYRVNNFVG